MRIHSSVLPVVLGFVLLVIVQSCTDEVDDGLTRYNNDVSTIMSANCTTCHGGTSPQAGLDLTTYANVRDAAENGNLVNRINDAANPMPPGGLMSTTERTTVDNWVSGGFLEN